MLLDDNDLKGKFVNNTELIIDMNLICLHSLDAILVGEKKKDKNSAKSGRGGKLYM